MICLSLAAYAAPTYGRETQASFICQLPSYNQPSVITVDSDERSFRLEYYSNNSRLRCYLLYRDGAIASAFSGPNAEACSAGQSSQHFRQHVTFDGNEVTATLDSPGAFSFTLDLRTGILRSDLGIIECHRAGG